MNVIIERRHRKRASGCRRDWTRQWLGVGSRLHHGHYHMLMPELRFADPTNYFNYLNLGCLPRCLSSFYGVSSAPLAQSTRRVNEVSAPCHLYDRSRLAVRTQVIVTRLSQERNSIAMIGARSE